MRNVSKKRARENQLRKKNARNRWGETPICYACLPFQMVGIERTQTGCLGRADDLHELVSRGRGGSITDMSNALPVSRACHTYAHAHPEAAEAAGLLVPGEPVAQPLRVQDPWTGKMPRSIP